MLQEADERRIHVIISIVLQYACEMLLWIDVDSSPFDVVSSQIRFRKKSCRYATVLFNDEAHTFDQVARALVRAIDCTEDKATQLASLVDREGRSAVMTSSKDVCKRIKEVITRFTSRDGRAPLLVRVLDCKLVAHQSLALALLEWVSETVVKFPPLLRIVCEILFLERIEPVQWCDAPTESNSTASTNATTGPAGAAADAGAISADGRKSVNGTTQMGPGSSASSGLACEITENLIYRVLYAHTQLWKTARLRLYQLMYSSILMNKDYRLRFSKLLMQVTVRLVQEEVYATNVQ
jgi:ATP-dependent Clp protease adapter protein ClpS